MVVSILRVLQYTIVSNRTSHIRLKYNYGYRIRTSDTSQLEAVYIMLAINLDWRFGNPIAKVSFGIRMYYADSKLSKTRLVLCGGLIALTFIVNLD